jgi:ABC-2 type transport system permease protein
MIRAIRAEWGKTWSVRAPLLCLLGTVLLVVTTSAALGNDFVHGIGMGERPPGAAMPLVSALGPAVQFGLLTFTAFTMTLVTSEYTTGSIRSTLQAAPRRWVVLTSKAVIGLLVGFVLGAAVGALGLAAADLALQGHAAPAGESLPPTTLRAASLFAVSSVLVVALGAIIRSSVGTLACGAVLLVGTLALPASASVWTPGGAAGEFLEWSAASYPPVWGLAVIALWAGAIYLLALWSLHRRDA